MNRLPGPTPFRTGADGTADQPDSRKPAGRGYKVRWRAVSSRAAIGEVGGLPFVITQSRFDDAGP